MFDNYLMPCPGPQRTFAMIILYDPGPMETQSSPVPIVTPVILTWEEPLMWMPSVFGLSEGAVMSIALMTTFTLWWMAM